MDINVDQNHLLSALALAQGVADRKGITPILKHVHLRVQGNTLHCSATDMTVWVTESISIENGREGAFTTDVRHLVNVVRTLPGGKLRLRGGDGTAVIKAGRSEFKMLSLEAGDFPPMPNLEAMGVASAEVSSLALATMIHKVLYSVSNDDARPNLSGMLFECDGKTASTVSTDGHRLSVFKDAFAGPKLAKGVIIPRKGLIDLRRFLDRVEGDVLLSISPKHLFVRATQGKDAMAMAIKLNEVPFPPYQAVIPKSHKAKMVFVRVELLAALRRVEIMAPERTSLVTITISDNTLELSADDPSLGESRQDLATEYQGERFETSLNSRYLIEYLEVLDGEKVILEIAGPLDPSVLRCTQGPEHFSVIMPMRK